MLRPAATRRKSLFAPPPWTDRSPDWRRLDRRLPPDHLARCIDRVVLGLDLQPLRDAYAGTGSLPYRPDLLLRVVLYEVRCGHHAPAAWERHAREHEPVRWLARGCEPNRSRWYAFRDRLGALLDDLNRQVLALALEQALTRAERASLDGTFVAANASRYRLVGAETLANKLAVLRQACADEVRGLPLVAPPRWLATTAAGRVRQCVRSERSQARLAERQQQRQQQRACDRNQAQPVRLALSDPDAVPGSDQEKVYRPLYNVQLLREVDSPLILAYAVFAQASDAGTLQPLLTRTRTLLGRLPTAWLMDAAYATGPQLRAAEEAQIVVYAPWQEQGPGAAATRTKPPTWLPKESFVWQEQTQTYVCPQGQRLELAQVRTQQRAEGERVALQVYRGAGAVCNACPLAVWCTPQAAAGRTVSRSEHEERFERLRARMATAEAQALYKLRGQTVELGFADFKVHRRLRRLSGRGLARARVEVGLCVLAHNAYEVFKTRQEAAGSAPAATPDRENS